MVIRIAFWLILGSDNFSIFYLLSKRSKVTSHSSTDNNALHARTYAEILEYHLHLICLKLVEGNFLVLHGEVRASSLIEEDRDNFRVISFRYLLKDSAALKEGLVVHEESASR